MTATTRAVDAADAARLLQNPGAVASIALALVLGAFAATVDVSNAAHCGFKGDEATYYSLANSLARDLDFTYEHKDLVRVWEEFCAGPEGIFLKKGKTVHLGRSDRFPFVRWVKNDDPVHTRYYYSKSYIYPLVAAPLVRLFGTNGFLILHALLLSLDLFVAYTFLVRRGSAAGAALTYAAAFLVVSVVPVYFVWLTPELFNFSLALYAMFLWSLKEVEPVRPGKGRFLQTEASSYLAAALIGVLTFSKPPHALLMLPLVALAAGRRQWRGAATMGLTWGLAAGVLFLINLGITGEINYQGGDRKTFYGRTGFPLANQNETFENIGGTHGRDAIMVGDVLVNRHTLTVFRQNVWYFVFGRSSGLVPYFFPGVMSAVLFLGARRRHAWQWLVGATIVAGMVSMLLVWPFTYSGGGGPVGNRYFLSFYPLFLFLTPPLTGVASALMALAIGALFTAKVVLNPFYSSSNPGEHLKAGPLRWLPLELTLMNDLPVAAHADRSMRPLAGTPPVWAYLPDDNVFAPEDGGWVWVKGQSSAEIVLRAPVVDAGGGTFVTKAIARLGLEIQNGGRADRVTVSTGRDKRTLEMKPSEIVRLTLAVPDGVPYRRDEQPTSYLYVLSITTTSGFVPFLEGAAGEKDNRFLGARIHVVPEYVDAETSTWSLQPPKN